MVEHGHVGIHVVKVVGVGRVAILVPAGRQRTVQVEYVVFWFGLVIHTVKACNLKSAENRYTYIYIYI